jgi:hypothetical protein
MVAAHLVINEVLANIKELSTGCFKMTIIISNIFTTYRKNGSKSCSFYNVTDIHSKYPEDKGYELNTLDS